MTLYDSSVRIDDFDGIDETVGYVERNADERAVTPPRVLFEVYRGEVFKSGATEFDAVEGALEWTTVVEATRTMARTAAELQADPVARGTPLTARDVCIAGAADSLGETLAVSDADVAGVTGPADVDVDVVGVE